MHIIEKKTIVPYLSEEIFQLISDIDSYPNFLSWCVQSELQKISETEQKATLHIAYGPIRQTFTTKNELIYPKRISMDLVEGPFQTLTGYWDIQELGNNEKCKGCMLTLSLKYSFKNKIIERIIGSMFHHITSTLVDCFLTEAKKRYADSN